MNKMKCYVVRDPDAYEFGVTTVFAKSAAKAKYAVRNHEEMGDDNTFDQWKNFTARRFPAGDKFYKEGVSGLDWENMEHRKVLIEKLSWSCDPNNEYSDEECGCGHCTCRDICPRFGN
jgi:hypothetical protein